jgi:hypothetical protein
MHRKESERHLPAQTQAGNGDTNTPTNCPLHGYTEMSARNKLARHRARGDDTQIALYHDECNQWHVFARPDRYPSITAHDHDDERDDR